jgi:hypothetical protein
MCLGPLQLKADSLKRSNFSYHAMTSVPHSYSAAADYSLYTDCVT